jgi:hypothetical protein
MKGAAFFFPLSPWPSRRTRSRSKDGLCTAFDKILA